MRPPGATIPARDGREIMASASSLIPELDDIVKHGSAERRADAIARISELFMAGAARFETQHVALFDDILTGLVPRTEIETRMELAERLSRLDNAPPTLVKRYDYTSRAHAEGAMRDPLGRITPDRLIRRDAGDRDQTALAQAQPGRRPCQHGPEQHDVAGVLRHLQPDRGHQPQRVAVAHAPPRVVEPGQARQQQVQGHGRDGEQQHRDDHSAAADAGVRLDVGAAGRGGHS